MSVVDTASDDRLLRITPLDDVAGFRVDGEVDVSSRAELAAALAATGQAGGDVVVDLSGVKFIDVEGLQMLVRVARGLTEGRVLVLRRPPPLVWRLLQLMNWDLTPGLRVVSEPNGAG